MKRWLMLFSVFFWSVVIAGAQEKKEFNFGFEESFQGYPVGWNGFTDQSYIIAFDSVNTYSGKYAATIRYYGETESDGKMLFFQLPANYTGRELKISAYIRTKDVTDGYAGLFCMIHPIVSDDMSDKGVTGTTDWMKYEITLPMDSGKIEAIVIGCVLTGRGQAWFDDFKVTIDGEEIYERLIVPADLDKEFDNGSDIILPALSEQLITNLELLGKLWGFMKYHHPEVGKGNYNWDYELFRILPEYLKVKNVKARDKLLLKWIGSYDKPVSEIKPASTPDDALLKPDVSWLENGKMSSALREAIQQIHSNRHQGDNYYIRLFPNVRNPEFTNENPYSDMPYPDAGFRLLSLYRYWNMIQYFFPYRNLTDKDWNNVLGEYIPVFLTARNQQEYELAALRIIVEVGDSHAGLWSGKIQELKGSKAPPIKVSFVEDKLVISDFFNPELTDTARLRIGDVITHINGRNVEAIIDSLMPYCPASNEASRLKSISEYVLWSNDRSILIDYLSSAGSRSEVLSLYEPQMLNRYWTYRRDEMSGISYKFINDSMGYVTLTSIKEEDIAEIKRLFFDTKGIIIDIRNYPNTFVPYLLGSYFVSEPRYFAKFTCGNVNNPGEFSFMPDLIIPKDSITYHGKLVVLINEFSISQSEFTAMAFRAGDNTTIVGSQTAGADGNISGIVLPGGLQTLISGLGVYYSDGTVTQRIGIIPDVEVRPTIQGLIEGRDEVLERAIEIINRL